MYVLCENHHYINARENIEQYVCTDTRLYMETPKDPTKTDNLLALAVTLLHR